jgi:hypothetical protein
MASSSSKSADTNDERRGITSGKPAALCHERAKLSMLLGPPTWRIRENEEDLARTFRKDPQSGQSHLKEGVSRPPSIPFSAQMLWIHDRIPQAEVSRVVRI